MSDWSHGYNVSVGYTYGFGRQMAPDWLDLCAHFAGYASPRREKSAPFRYLDLGSGQGLGLCLLAAANPQGEFVGVDFLPEHIEHSNSVAEAAELTNVRFICADFVDLAAAWPEDIGTFDYVALHGIVSWVSSHLREAVVQCVAHAARPESFVYVSYNTHPGWLGAVPFQHVALRLKETTGKSGRDVIEESAKFFNRLRSANAGIFKILPALGAQVEAVKTRRTSYLVHEFLHENWRPLWHSEVAKEFGQANLAYLGTSVIAESLLPELLPPALRDAVVDQQDDALRQDLQDIVINQSFRRDIFCQEPRSEPAAADKARLHLVMRPAAGNTLKVETAFGEIALLPLAFAEIIEALDDGPKSIEELTALPSMLKQGKDSATQVLRLLLQGRWIAVGAAEAVSPEPAQRLNAFIARAASEGAPYSYIALPALGSAVAASDIDLMLIDCWLESLGKADAKALAKGVSGRLAKLGRKLQHNGKRIEGAEAQRRLIAEAGRFIDESLPRWRQLGAL